MKTKVLLAVLLAGAVAALAVIFVGGKSTAGDAGASAYGHTEAILAFGPRPAGSPALDKVRDYVGRELEKHGWVNRRAAFSRFTPQGRIEFVNVVARYRGAETGASPWERPVRGILAAHIDSKRFDDRKFLGADDAASAVALIISLAAELAQDPEKAGLLELVFFDGEEAFGPNLTPTDGIYGSRHYAAEWVRRDEKPAFGIVLDMIGHENLQIAYPPDSPPALVKVLTEAVAAEKVAGHFRRARAPIIDDHLPLNNAGIPTIDIIADFGATNWWHTPRDNLDIISAESLDITARVVRRMLDNLLN